MSNVDTPEGTVWHKVRMSETLFRVLGASGVEWGAPDGEGFYTPTVFLGPDGALLQRDILTDPHPFHEAQP